MDYVGDLILLRSLPGSGKSTLAGIITPYNVAADDYFDLFNNGEFDSNKLQKAHTWCFEKFKYFVDIKAKVVAVHNTFTREWEFQNYIDYALENNYRVHTVIVENRHGSLSLHNVPDEAIHKMKNRFNIKL